MREKINKIKKVIKGLSKASKTHAAQAKTLKGVLKKKKNGNKKKVNKVLRTGLNKNGELSLERNLLRLVKDIYLKLR